MFPDRLFPARLFPNRMFPPGGKVAVPGQPEVPGVTLPSTGGGDLTRLLTKQGEEPLTGLLREVMAEVDLFILADAEYAGCRMEMAEAECGIEGVLSYSIHIALVAGASLGVWPAAQTAAYADYIAEGSVELDPEDDTRSTVHPPVEDDWLLEDGLLGLL